MIEDPPKTPFHPSPLKPIQPPEDPDPRAEVPVSHFIINATRAVREECEEFNEYASRAFEETIKLLSQGNAFEFTPIGIMVQKEEAFGPFESRKLATYMIPSELDEKGKDWKGHTWILGVMPMIWEDFIVPNYQVPRAYWCRECGHTQAFKGSCGNCRGQGRKFIPTIEIKDWEGDL